MMSVTDNDETKRLKMFPNEVWDMILEHVKEARHYQKASNALAYFRNRLLFRAPKILFQEVIQIFLKCKYAISTGTGSWIVARQVCREWKESLDQVIQTQEYFILKDNKKLIDMGSIIFDERHLLVKRLQFYSVQDFTKLEEHFDSTHLGNNTNPFVRRKVQLHIQDVLQTPQLYLDSCLRFLQKYGHHIRVCIIRVSFPMNPDDFLHFYNRKMNLILELMPNLQASQIVIGSRLQHDLPNPVTPASFPRLPHLEYLSIFGCFVESYYPVVQQLLEKNPQVQNVDILSSMIRVNVFLELLPNLRALALTSDRFQGLLNGQFTSRVERLWLDMTRFSETSELVFEILKRHFSKSLVELHLSLSRRESMGAASRLVLPNLKILHLEMESPQRLELLLSLKDTLEELHLSLGIKSNHQVNCRFEIVMPKEDDTNEYKFQVYVVWREPQKSSIWTLFPRLKVFTIKLFTEQNLPEKYTCTRKRWQKEMWEQNMV